MWQWSTWLQFLADHNFQKGEVVAEYIGEYASDTVADLREKRYREQRIQDYQFRVDGSLVSTFVCDGYPVLASLYANSHLHLIPACSGN